MRGLVARAVLQTPDGRRRYLERMAELSTNVFRVETMTTRVQELAARVRPALRSNAGESQRHDRFVNALIDRIVRREESLREQLAAATTPLRFDTNGIALLGHWNFKADFGNPSFDRAKVPAEVMQITATGAPAYGSWRTSVLLEQGDYRLEGRVKTQDLEFGPGVTRGGVTLRVSGDRAAKMSTTLPKWTVLACDFSIRGLEDVELVCELRASRGWAWFETGSLRLVRKSKPSG
jgi:hypothetical protein